MKFLKNNLKVIIAFILGLILAGGIVYAATSAKDVSYMTAKNDNIKNVEDALNDLYEKKSNTTNLENILFNYSAGERITTRDCNISLEKGNYIVIASFAQNGYATSKQPSEVMHNLNCLSIKGANASFEKVFDKNIRAAANESIANVYGLNDNVISIWKCIIENNTSITITSPDWGNANNQENSVSIVALKI